MGSELKAVGHRTWAGSVWKRETGTSREVMSNMLVNRRVLGISMDRRCNRRLLAAFLYFCLAVFYALAASVTKLN